MERGSMFGTDISLSVVKGDITLIECDAIVNAANNGLYGGGGVDGAIHKKGGSLIAAECGEIRKTKGGCKTGEAVYTTAGLLPAKFVIHTVGPVWKGGTANENSLLSSCYSNSLLLADRLQCTSITFPNISTVVYGFPKNTASEIAIRSVKEALPMLNFIKQIIFVCFDEENHAIYSRALV